MKAIVLRVRPSGREKVRVRVRFRVVVMFRVMVADRVRVYAFR